MRFLVTGSGGREHALVRALKFSPSVSEVHAVPGSEGMSSDALCHSVNLKDDKAVEAFVRRYQFDCAVIGPERHLVDGLPDFLRSLGVNVVGPSQAAAQLEGSKVFAKEFMRAAEVPTSPYVVVSSVAEVIQAAGSFTPPFVLKVDGLAEGKGVFICQELSELRAAAESVFEKRQFGAAGSRALLEQFVAGRELSFLVLTNGSTWEPLPLARDHKRLQDGDRGPNTGGMGVVSPIAIDSELRERIGREVIDRTIRHLAGSGLLYRGVLYFGLMLTDQGPQVLEFNVRFGDPEAQVILPQLNGDWGYVLSRLAIGELEPLQWKPIQVACVVMAAPGYPSAPQRDLVIEGDLGTQTPSSYFLAAGTRKAESGQWLTNGGRILNSIGLGSSMAEALSAAYKQAGCAHWQGLQMRTDIGRHP